MDLRKTLRSASDALRDAGIEHALIGGFALAIYAVHRATADIDLIADGRRVVDIKVRLAEAGFSLRFETSEVLQFSGIGYLDVLLANRPLSLRMIRDSIHQPRVGVRVLRAEDIIGLKIQAYCNDRSRELRDKADIQALLRSGGPLDWARIKEYADLFGEYPHVQALAAT